MAGEIRSRSKQIGRMTMERVGREGLQIAATLADFLEKRVLPGTGVEPGAFWKGLAGIVDDFTPRNRELLETRAELQRRIDEWHRAHPGQPEPEAYRGFLEEIGYLKPEGPDFRVDTGRVDAEIASIPGPQLVVPVTNARYALNAANARWGSLYDALYGTDALGDRPTGAEYDPARGARVVEWAKRFLDDAVPLEHGSHAKVAKYIVVDQRLAVLLEDGQEQALRDPDQFAGYKGTGDAPAAVRFHTNHLQGEIGMDRARHVGHA